MIDILKITNQLKILYNLFYSDIKYSIGEKIIDPHLDYKRGICMGLKMAISSLEEEYCQNANALIPDEEK